MKHIKAVLWITRYTSIGGAILGGVWGLFLGRIVVVDLRVIENGIVVGPVVGGLLGWGVGLGLGLVVGLSVALTLVGMSFPLQALQTRRVHLVGTMAAGVSIVGLLLLSLLTVPSHSPGSLLFWLIPELAAFAGAVWVVRRYTKYVSVSPRRPDQRTERGVIAQLFGLVTVWYGLFVIAPLFIDLLFGEAWDSIGLYNIFAHLLWMPAFVFLAITVLWRRWVLALLMLVPVTAFMLTFGVRYTRYLTGDETVHATATDKAYLEVMTFNIFWLNEDFDAMIRVIEESDADIVAVQELDRRTVRRMSERLQDDYPYVAFHPQWNGVHGQGLLSRYPIINSRYWKREGVYGAQEAVIQFESGEYTKQITIHNVHVFNPVGGEGLLDMGIRTWGMENILERTADDTSDYRLLLGDFNLTELSDDYDLLTAAGWNDAYAEKGAGIGLTFAPRLMNLFRVPLLRLDYIFTQGRIYPQDIWVNSDTGGSDHHPVMARLWLDLE